MILVIYYLLWYYSYVNFNGKHRVVVLVGGFVIVVGLYIGWCSYYV